MKQSCLTLIIALGTLTAPAQAQQTDLPPPDIVTRALDNYPSVEAASMRVTSARAQGDALRKGPHEISVQGSYIRRSVVREGGYDEFDGTVMRPFRLPGKAALDREAGTLGVEVAHNKMEDARHQAALTLAGLWQDWVTAGTHYRNEGRIVANLESALKAVKRRTTLRDAAQLDVDQADAALRAAQAQQGMALAAMAQAKAMLAATFPEIPLADVAPELAEPALPSQPLESMRDLVIARSHEIGAADREAARQGTLAQRAKADRIADPSVGVRLFSERSGDEKGAGVVFSMPLGGGHRKALADQASADANAARIDLELVRRSVVATADADLSNAKARMIAWQAAQRSAESAGAAAQRTERGYQLGAIDLTDMLYVQRQANEARRAEIEARSEAARALLKLQIDSHSIWAPVEDKDD